MQRMYSLPLAALALAISFSMTLQAVAAPKSAPKAAIATKTQAKLPATRIAVLRFSGPGTIDIDADEVWKVRNKTSAPGEGELSTLTIPLQKALTNQLQTQLGNTVIPEQELSSALSKVPPSVGSPQISHPVAQKLGIKYYVTGTVDKIGFDGNTVLPDHYDMVVSAQLVDATTGTTVWTEPAQKFLQKHYTKKGGGSVAQTFTTKQIPDVAQTLASKIAGAVGR